MGESDRLWRYGDTVYELTTTTDVSRDGVGLEIVERRSDGQARTAIELFYLDDTGAMTFSAENCDDLPVELVERAIATAKVWLVPRHA